MVKYPNSKINSKFNKTNYKTDTISGLNTDSTTSADIRVSDINLSKHTFTTTVKDGRIDTFSSVHIKGKGGKERTFTIS